LTFAFKVVTNILLNRWQRTLQRKPIDDDYDDIHGVWRPKEEPVLYAPERGPPIIDFVKIFAAFVVAVIAAYYTIT
jgi:hypothetical protein